MAAFGVRHVELDNIGCGKKRVLKPPGGGTSDIFSSDVDTTPTKPRSSVASPPHPVSAVLPHEDTNGVENGGTTPTPSEGSSPSPPPPQTKTVQPNPVTGQGYSETDSTPTRPKQRVPPGGYASKLW